MKRFVWLLWLSLICACAQEEAPLASTQITLRIYNDDQALLDSMSSLSITFALRGENARDNYPVKRFRASSLSWPVDVPIVPSKSELSSAQFEVIVRAHGTDDSVLAETRAISSFARGERRVLEAWLFTCPSTQYRVCATAECRGEDCRVCKFDGSCVAVGVTNPNDLTQLTSNVTPDTKPVPEWTGGKPDAGVDAGTDAQLDASDDGAITCSEGALRCEGTASATRSVCRSGKWEAAESCKDGELCDPKSTPAGQCSTKCMMSALRCKGEASAERERCDESGAWVAAESCGADSLCNRAASTSGECSPIVQGCAGKAPNTAVCVGSTRIVCGPDLVSTTSIKSCKSASYCEQGKGSECAQCITDEHACEGTQLQVCNDTHDGFVNKGAPCTTDAPCNKDLGMCTKQVCRQNEWSCNGNTLRHCNAIGTDYVASDTQQCGAGLCNATGQRCNACEPQKIRCLEEGGKGRVQCSMDGRTEASIGACPNSCLLGSCVNCRPSDTRCDPSAPLRFAQTCLPEGDWGNRTDCFATSKTCLHNTMTGANACDGQCSAGSVRCDPVSKQPQSCVSGVWTPGMSCQWPAQICSNGACAENKPYDVPRGGVDGTWANWQVAAATVYLIRIVPEKTALLNYFRLIGRVKNGVCRMVAYSDQGGRPGNVLTFGNANIDVPGVTASMPNGGINGAAPWSKTITLTAGTPYWIGGDCSAASGTVELYQKSSSTERYYFFGLPIGDDFPSPAPVGVSRTGLFSFFVEVQDTP